MNEQRWKEELDESIRKLNSVPAIWAFLSAKLIFSSIRVIPSRYFIMKKWPKDFPL